MNYEVMIVFSFSVLPVYILVLQLYLRRCIKFTIHVHNHVSTVTFFLKQFTWVVKQTRNGSLKEETQVDLQRSQVKLLGIKMTSEVKSIRKHNENVFL